MFIERKKLQTADEYKKLIPLSAELKRKKLAFDNELRGNLISRRRFVVVCGPCSADDPVAMDTYLRKLKVVSDRCPNLLVVARIYTAKPHTNGQGFKGAAFHKNIADQVNIDSGIVRCRQMMINCLEIGLPIADELLFPELYGCLDDLVSYWFVGARSSEDNLHRHFASGLDVCCGVKNSTDGSIAKVVDSLQAVSSPCVFPYSGCQLETEGCKRAHIVLRGGQIDGKYFSNIDARSIESAKELLLKQGLNDFVMADLSHANSCKLPVKQLENAVSVARDGNVNGVMIESYLDGGKMSGKFGASQTDDCLDFEQTEKLLLQLQNDVACRLL